MPKLTKTYRVQLKRNRKGNWAGTWREADYNVSVIGRTINDTRRKLRSAISVALGKSIKQEQLRHTLIGIPEQLLENVDTGVAIYEEARDAVERSRVELTKVCVELSNNGFHLTDMATLIGMSRMKAYKILTGKWRGIWWRVR